MVRDDLQACLQAYQFAELMLGGFLQKNENEREHALQAAQDLRDSVEERYQAIVNGASGGDSSDTLKASKARLEQKLEDARARS